MQESIKTIDQDTFTAVPLLTRISDDRGASPDSLGDGLKSMCLSLFLNTSKVTLEPMTERKGHY